MKFIMNMLFFLLMVYFFEGCNSSSNKTSGVSQAGVRTVDIPMREHGYSNFETTLLTSAEAYDTFVAQVQAQDFWNDKNAFLTALEAAKVDFTHENLLLYRITEGSGSIALSVLPAVVENGIATVTVTRSVPEVGTADMAYYALAYALDHNITAITVTVGDQNETLSNSDTVMCTMEYAPVCSAKTVQCFAAPCYPVPQTYSNRCMSDADGAEFRFEGECPDGSIPEGCTQWFDGCNTCTKSGELAICTEMACGFPTGPIACLD